MVGQSEPIVQPVLTGEQLHRILRRRYHLQMEMVSGKYVLGMTSIMDQKEGFDRLVSALYEIDAKPGKSLDEIREEKDFVRRMYAKNCRKMEIYQAMDLPCQEVSFEEAVGKVSADYIYLYPPGIPMIVPGELITDKFIANINECIHQNLQIEGSSNLCFGRINVI